MEKIRRQTPNFTGDSRYCKPRPEYSFIVFQPLSNTLLILIHFSHHLVSKNPTRHRTTLPCKQCGQTVPGTRALKLHGLAAHFRKCPKCHENLSSPRKSPKDTSLSTRTASASNAPTDCPLIFEGTDEIRRHHLRSSSAIPAAATAERRLTRRTNNKEHIAETEHSTDFVCCDCGTEIGQRREVEERNTTGAFSPRARQDIETRPTCSRRFLSRACRRVHVGTCESICGLCCRCFKSHAALLDHLNSLKHRPLGKFMDRDKARGTHRGEAHDTDRLITKPVDQVASGAERVAGCQ